LEELGRFGIRSALVAAGGDVVAGEAPPGREGWQVGVAGIDARPVCTLILKNRAVSTSGDTWQYVEIDGLRYSHIVDPVTGRALTGQRSATVVAVDGASADALATSVCVLGLPRGLQIADSIGAAAMFREVRAGDTVSLESTKWRELRCVALREAKLH
ncbi:MAG TPA: FAD:protein FMN transferase, partial [Blastocatellia bacterium]|nr:FAD:protein FMN transferase [Blastocatellia bacterium]